MSFLIMKDDRRQELHQIRDHNSISSAWKDTQTALGSLSTCLRSLVGFENVTVALCLRNGSRADIYSVAGENFICGTSGRNSFPSQSRVTETDTHRKCLADRDEKDSTFQHRSKFSVNVLHGLSTKSFRSFFTAVRRSLGLSCFKWPEQARCRFLEMSDDPIPLGPGRANSGRDSLILMLQLSSELDEGWRKCTERELRSLVTKDGYVETSTAAGNVTGSDVTRMGEQSNIPPQIILQELSTEAPLTVTGDSETQRDAELSTALELAERLPSDCIMVTVGRKNWVSLDSLMNLVCYPANIQLGGRSCEWYIHRTPADGNCLFSAVMVAANVRGLLPTCLNSVSSMRATLKLYLKQLSAAGSKSSIFRREWLASCVYELEDREFQRLCSSLLGKALQSSAEMHIEDFLLPLRHFVSNWADMVGGSHWGGLLRVELVILATITGSAIEVLRKMQRSTSSSFSSSGTNEGVAVCDTRTGGTIETCERLDLVFPIRSQLPSMRDSFISPSEARGIRGGWIGAYPVLRVILNDKHYSACTSKHGYPISPRLDTPLRTPWSEGFNLSDTLVKAFSVLSKEEEVYYQRAVTLIQDWQEASRISPESARHADTLVMHSSSAELSVSMLSRLEVSPALSSTDERFMLSDEVLTSYMHLLEKRANLLAADALKMGVEGPPRCRYMNSWFYRALDRGLAGPSSKRKRTDLSAFSMVILPALVDAHWMLAVCYLNEHIIGVYDPFLRAREDVFRTVRRWVQAQLPNRDGKEWVFKELRESRECVQIGSIDCGVYVCKAAESLGLGVPIRMSQWDVPFVRKRMMVELFRQEATAVKWPRT